MLKKERARGQDLKLGGVLLLALFVVLASPVLGGRKPAKEPRPTPLPAIELPPPPPVSAGARPAREAGERTSKGDYEGALLMYRYAWASGLRSMESTYNSACAAAVTGRVDEAFTWLGRAAAAGWRDAAHLEVDTDLDPLREDSRFGIFAKKVEANARRYDEENNAELRQLVEADQAARQNVPDIKQVSKEAFAAFWDRVSAEDAERRNRVAEVIAAGGAGTGDDYLAAALVYQHGDELADFARAREYAAQAVRLGNENGRWLAAAAWDRWLVNAGYPQRFGTQYICEPDCRLEEWDENMTDEERARWNVPSLEVAKTRMSRR